MSEQLVGTSRLDGSYDIAPGMTAKIVTRNGPTGEEVEAELKARAIKEEEEQKKKQEHREEQLTTYMNVLNLEAQKNTLVNKVQEYREAGNDMLRHIGGEYSRDIISEKLATVKTIEELTKRISTDEGLLWFFTNDDTGEILTMNIKDIDAKREMEFRRGLLLYLKQTDIYQAEIDDACKQLDEAQKEFDVGVAESMQYLADNIIDTAKMFRQVAAESPNYSKLMRRAQHIESAYTFEVLKEVVKEHPSVVEKTIIEMRKEGAIVDLGKRYRAKLKSAKVQSSLFSFIGEDNGQRSVEYMVLPKDKLIPGTENLFIFILIRFFAMNSWTLDKAVKAFHSAVCITLSRLMCDKLPDEERMLMINNMIELLQPYWDKFLEMDAAKAE